MSRETNLTFNNIRGFNSASAITVGSIGAEEYKITAGKSKIIFQNTGNKKVWFGDQDVDGDNGVGTFIVPGQWVIIDRPTQDFIIYFRCETGESGQISPNEGVNP